MSARTPSAPARSLPARRTAISTLALAGLLASPLLVAAPADAATDGSAVVISEVYGAGGNSGASFNQDFVELYNPTDAAVDLTGKSVQYRSASGTANPSGVAPLTGSIPAKGHYLVGLATGSTGAALPATPDQQNTSINLSGSTGTVFLANQTSALTAPATGSITGNPAIADLVGFGTSNTFETALAPAPSATNSIGRAATGTDSDNNSADFTAGAPTPTNAGGDTVEPPDTTVHDATIAEVQGTSDTSPMAGQIVRTTGVVTASYPTGGFNGFYLQTAGTGASHAADQPSDAVFVYLGASGTFPAVGDHVEVTGPVSEFAGLTEISPAADGVKALDTSAAAPTPLTDPLPGTDAGRESREGMLVQPGRHTVSDVYTLNQYAEIKLAAGDTALRTPTDVARPGSAEAAAVVADNAARAVTLDDGSSLNYFTTGKDTPLPWITATKSVRVGAPVEFTKPVVFDFRNGTWKYQPTSQLTAANDASVNPVRISDTRAPVPAVAGDLKIASFNVLNSFKETGEDYVADGGTCSSYNDRAGNPITVNTCNGEGPRGAWNTENRLRQQAKVVQAINSIDADVLSLEEIENSAKFAGAERRDDALADLVTALNAAAGAEKWAFVPSPAPADQPDLAGQDVIRTAFIYQPASVVAVGGSHILTTAAAFDNAREPLAQVFKPVGGSASEEFLAVVNHFKSKGSGSGADADQGDGQGGSNASRVAQASALVDFVDGLKASTGTERVFLTGDFNSYTQEDPMQVLYDAGYTDIGSKFHSDEYTYVFDGMAGSLDHVLGNDAAMSTVQDGRVWNINSVESVAYEYSRFNYNATNFYAPDAYRSSDHDPEIVGFSIPKPVDTTTTASYSPKRPGADKPTVFTVQVTGADGRPVDGGTVQIRSGSQVLGTGDVVDGVATISVRFTQKNQKVTVTAAFLGTGTAKPSETSLSFTVKPRAK